MKSIEDLFPKGCLLLFFFFLFFLLLLSKVSLLGLPVGDSAIRGEIVVDELLLFLGNCLGLGVLFALEIEVVLDVFQRIAEHLHLIYELLAELRLLQVQLGLVVAVLALFKFVLVGFSKSHLAILLFLAQLLHFKDVPLLDQVEGEPLNIPGEAEHSQCLLELLQRNRVPMFHFLLDLFQPLRFVYSLFDGAVHLRGNLFASNAPSYSTNGSSKYGPHSWEDNSTNGETSSCSSRACRHRANCSHGIHLQPSPELFLVDLPLFVVPVIQARLSSVNEASSDPSCA